MLFAMIASFLGALFTLSPWKVRLLEVLSTALALLALYWKIKKKKVTWLLHGFRKLLSFLVYFHGRLYTKCALDIIFIFTSIYGWFSWRKPSSTAPSSSTLSYKRVLLLLLIALVFSPVLGYYQAHYTATRFPYTTALHGFFILYAYLLLAKKKQAGWLFWIFSNFLYVPVCFYVGQYFFVAKYCVYTAVACKGYWQWRKEQRSILRKEPVGGIGKEGAVQEV